MKKSPLVRKSDPQTSRDAAKKASKFAADHISAIYRALRLCKKAVTPSEMVVLVGWPFPNYYQIQRRGAQMERMGLIIRGPEKRDGQRVWRLAK